VNASQDQRIVVLDDDPLGGQCLRDVPVLTSWEQGVLTSELMHSPAFLLLTNTRSLDQPDAVARAREVGIALREAALTTGLTVTPVWRSDSTLRGHFCREMHAFYEAFDTDATDRPVCVFMPYFGEAGRVTQDDTQYVVTDGALMPVHETEFARDPAFAFDHSHLPSWIEAQSGGEHPMREVTSVSLLDLRDGNSGRVVDLLTHAPAGGAIVVNATTDDDLRTFVTCLREAEGAGKRFLCTGAAPLIRARLGQDPHPLLSAQDIGLRGETGGLTVIGSYVEKTTAQLHDALADGSACGFEAGLDHDGLGTLATAISKRLAAGDDVVLYTSRAHAPGAAGQIASALTGVVGRIDVRPRYLLVKGGSTASSLATQVLGVRRAVVLGQLLAGVPVWRLGEESRWPGLPFVIFAGNVGTPQGLTLALRALREG
jgi:uncharacterized protein YgbK (DUF1537 family)